MIAFLTKRHWTLEAIDDVRPSGSRQSLPKTSAPTAAPRRINSYETRVAPKSKGCDLCKKENHPVRTCARFLQMTVDKRSAYIKRKQLCLNCFARGHQLRDCESTHSCFPYHARHHTLLHRGNTSQSPSNASPRPRSRSNFKARALIDSGSEGSFISERLFKLIKLPHQVIRPQVSGLNQTVSAESKKLC